MNAKLAEILEHYAFKEVMEIDPKQICITETVRAACEKNDCGNYGRNYMCPPAVGTLEEYKEIVAAYSFGILFSQVHIFTDRKEYRRYHEISMGFKKEMERLHREVVQSEVDGIVFSAGGCSICKTCGIIEGIPCRFPEEAMPSLEAAGIDVVRLTKETGFVYNHGEKSMTLIGLILYR